MNITIYRVQMDMLNCAAHRAARHYDVNELNRLDRSYLNFLRLCKMAQLNPFATLVPENTQDCSIWEQSLDELRWSPNFRHSFYCGEVISVCGSNFDGFYYYDGSFHKMDPTMSILDEIEDRDDKADPNMVTMRLNMEIQLSSDEVTVFAREKKTGRALILVDEPFSPDEHPEFDRRLGCEVYGILWEMRKHQRNKEEGK